MDGMGKMWLAGWKCGYMDAVQQLWDLEHAAYEAKDEARAGLIAEIVRDVRDQEQRLHEKAAAEYGS